MCNPSKKKYLLTLNWTISAGFYYDYYLLYLCCLFFLLQPSAEAFVKILAGDEVIQVNDQIVVSVIQRALCTLPHCTVPVWSSQSWALYLRSKVTETNLCTFTVPAKCFRVWINNLQTVLCCIRWAGAELTLWRSCARIPAELLWCWRRFLHRCDAETKNGSPLHRSGVTQVLLHSPYHSINYINLVANEKCECTLCTFLIYKWNCVQCSLHVANFNLSQC